MAKSTVLDRLKQWLAAGGAATELAVALGYQTSDAIRRWVDRGNIPRWRHSAVLDFLALKTARVKKPKKRSK